MLDLGNYKKLLIPGKVEITRKNRHLNRLKWVINFYTIKLKY